MLMSGQTSAGRGTKKAPRTGRSPVQSKVFLSRSPILDSAGHISAYQLDFVEIVKTENGPEASKPSDASICAFLDAQEPHSLALGRATLIRTNTLALDRLSDRTGWKDEIVFDIDLAGPEKEDIVGLLERLKREKVNFCLSNMALTEQTKMLFSPDCFVKVDVAGRNEGELQAIVSGLQSHPVRIIATSVKTRDVFDACSRLGFMLFHGPFFREPLAQATGSISPNHALLLDLAARTAREEDIRTIEEIFKKNPDLTFGLFNLVRSAYFRVAGDVTSIRQAITLLGYKDLQKWAALMLFTINHSDPSANPLFENVLVRARTLELASGHLRKKGLSDAAYMTGIFSLVPALFGVPMEKMVEKANLGEEIRDALLSRTGRLGAMLDIIEEIEKGEYEKCAKRTEEAGVDLERFLIARATALADYFTLTTPKKGEATEREQPSLEKRTPPFHGPAKRDPLPKKSWFGKVRAFFGHT